MTTLSSLPLDILLGIIQELTIDDILNLRSTCTKLYHVTDERSIWHAINQALLAVVPSPSVSSALNSMSSEDLRKRAITRIRLDERWRRPVIVPRRVQVHKCPQRPADAKLLPGGNWILVLYEDGRLHLEKIGCEEPAVTLARTIGDIPRRSFAMLLHSRGTPNLVSVLHCVWNNITLIHDIEVRVYQVQPDIPSISLKATTSVSLYCEKFAMEMGLLIIAGNDNANRMLHVKEVNSQDDISRAIHMRYPLRSDEWIHSVTILPQKRVMVTYGLRIDIYGIPPLQPCDGHDLGLVDAIDVVPQWTYDFCNPDDLSFPFVTPLFPAATTAEESLCIVFGAKFLHALRFSSRSPEVSVSLHPIDTDNINMPTASPSAIGFRHLIWHGINNPTALDVATFSLDKIDDLPAGFGPVQRMVQMSSISHLKSLESHEYARVSFEEESGRICLLNPHSDTRPWITVVDI